MSIFRDLGIRSIFDEDHSIVEKRWIALGMAATGVLLAVVYTWTEKDQENVSVRIIPARRATTAEQSTYEDSL